MATAATTYLSPREGAQLAVAECCRNLSVVGALPVAATNCLNFGNPERPEIMAQLVEAIEGMSDACRFFDTPITGGNVSLYNETLGEGIYPTPVIGIVGLMKTAAPVTIPFKNAGRSVILLGGAGTCDDVRFGGTQYAKEIEKQLWGLPPALDLDREKRVQEAIREIVAAGLAESAHDLSDGGLAVALAECCFGPAGIGAQIDLDSDLRPEILAFHEGPSRILISTAHPKQVAAIAERHGVEAPVVGATIETGMEIRQRGNTLGSWDIAALTGRSRGGTRSACSITRRSINSTTNAAWSPSTATPKHPSWPTSASTPCSIAGRRAPASAPRTATRSTPTSPWATWPISSPATVLAELPGNLAIGHTRYSTAGDTVLLNAQPFSVVCNKGKVAIAHNGNITNASELRARPGAAAAPSSRRPAIPKSCCT